MSSDQLDNDSDSELNRDSVELVVDDAGGGMRLDVFLAERLTGYSRVRLSRAIGSGNVHVEGRLRKASFRLHAGDTVAVRLPEVPREVPEPENVPLDILYEDACMVAVNKRPGMVVHPGRGHWKGTLVAALAYHIDKLSSIAGPVRPGIVHRLDRDTSGVIVVAKTDQAHSALAAQFEQRTTKKQYTAISVGSIDRDRDLIDLPIGVHPYQREKMAIRTLDRKARPARTFYEVRERFRGFSIISAMPHTGRTHQIRLHLAHIGCPVLCDRLYGGRSQITLGELRDGREDEPVVLNRQALHASRLELHHPQTGEPIHFEAPLPDELSHVIDLLRQYR